MKVLVVLLGVFIASLVVAKVATGDWNYAFCGNVAMCAMLLFTAIGHFAYVVGMEMMMPAAIPFKKTIVYLTGIFELVMGVALLFAHYRMAAAVMLIIFFVLVLPANISAAFRHVDYQKGTNEGSGPRYLWFRVPMQLFLIAWVWYFGIFLSPQQIH